MSKQPSGDFSYEYVHIVAPGDDAQPANSPFVPDFVPDPPVNQENGTKIGPAQEPIGLAPAAAQLAAEPGLTASGGAVANEDAQPAVAGFSFHEAERVTSSRR